MHLTSTGVPKSAIGLHVIVNGGPYFHLQAAQVIRQKLNHTMCAEMTEYRENFFSNYTE